MITTIKRNIVLKAWDIKEDSKGNPLIFSCKFIKKDGRIVYVPKAVACGLKANLKENKLRALLPVDSNGNKAGHVYPIGIDNIIEFNGMKVTL